MQITIIGKFSLGSDEGTSIGAGFNLGDKSSKISWVANARELVESLDTGTKTDLLICGTEINIDELKASLRTLGISAPMIIQSAALSKSAMNNTAGEKNAQLNSHLVGTRLSPDNDPSAWLGNENDPLRLGQRLSDMERSLILNTLTHCGGNRTYAADILGISSRTLRTKLQQYSAEGCTVKPIPQRQSSMAAPVSRLLS